MYPIEMSTTAERFRPARASYIRIILSVPSGERVVSNTYSGNTYRSTWRQCILLRTSTVMATFRSIAAACVSRSPPNMPHFSTSSQVFSKRIASSVLFGSKVLSRAKLAKISGRKRINSAKDLRKALTALSSVDIPSAIMIDRTRQLPSPNTSKRVFPCGSCDHE